jgi:hypothetical protein
MNEPKGASLIGALAALLAVLISLLLTPPLDVADLFFIGAGFITAEIMWRFFSRPRRRNARRQEDWR